MAGDMVPERLVPGTLDWDIYYYEHQQRYTFFAERVRGLRVLDASCGVGYGSSILAASGAGSVTGIDISQEAIDYACEHFADPAITFVVGNVHAMPLQPASFDMAVSFETVEHVEDPDAFMHEVYRVLKPGGLFVCSTPNRDWTGRGDNPYHLSEMSLSEFEAAFGQCFDLEERYYQSHSPGYLRHMDLLRELGRMEKPFRYSKLLNVENWLRRCLGKDSWDATPLSPYLARAVPGDFVIEPLASPRETHLTFILVGQAKARS